MWNLTGLRNLLLDLSSPALATEEAAATAITMNRWPGGFPDCPRCGAYCDRTGVQLECPRCRRKCTIFVGTPLGCLRRPRARAILLAIRAMAFSKQGISALQPSRELGVPHTSIWRHMHRIRALLPPVSWGGSEEVGVVRVCKRRAKDEGDMIDLASPAEVVASRHYCFAQGTVFHRLRTGSRNERLIGESVRMWLNGTFRGVRYMHLHRYAREAAARLSVRDPRTLLTRTLENLFKGVRLQGVWAPQW